MDGSRPLKNERELKEEEEEQVDQRKLESLSLSLSLVCVCRGERNRNERRMHSEYVADIEAAATAKKKAESNALTYFELLIRAAKGTRRIV